MLHVVGLLVKQDQIEEMNIVMDQLISLLLLDFHNDRYNWALRKLSLHSYYDAICILERKSVWSLVIEKDGDFSYPPFQVDELEI